MHYIVYTYYFTTVHVVCFGVLSHFLDPNIMLYSLNHRANIYAILIVPWSVYVYYYNDTHNDNDLVYTTWFLKKVACSPEPHGDVNLRKRKTSPASIACMEK